MKPKALLLSAAVLLGSASLALAQTYSEPPQTPAGPTSPQPGTTAQQQNMNDNAPAGSKSGMSEPSSTQSHNLRNGSAETRQAQSQAPRTSKHRTMASRRYEPRRTERDPATTALNLLEERGYRNFSNFHQTGRDFEVSANQNGRTVNVVVDPFTKTVRPQS
jgi:hypothetical protein